MRGSRYARRFLERNHRWGTSCILLGKADRPLWTGYQIFRMLEEYTCK